MTLTIEYVTVLRFHRNELLAAPSAAADIVDQRKVPVRRQGGAAAAHKLLKQLAQFIGINGEGKAAVIFAALIAERHIAGINIADLLRQPDHIPVAVRADDLYHRPVWKLRKSVVIQPGARANIQLAAVGGDDSCFSGFLRANRAKQRGDQFGEIVPVISALPVGSVCASEAVAAFSLLAKATVEKAAMQSITVSSTVSVRIRCLFFIVGALHHVGISGALPFHYPFRQGDHAAGVGAQEGVSAAPRSSPGLISRRIFSVVAMVK